MKHQCRELLLLIIYMLMIMIPAMLIVGSCNALIELQIDRHKILP